MKPNKGLSSNPINQQQIADALHGITLECIVLSACQSGMSSSDSLNAGLMTHLASQGIPHIIGMRESIFDSAGVKFAQSFCGSIAQGERVDIALQSAREAISQPLQGQFYSKDNQAEQAEQASLDALSFGQWCLPSLISTAPERPLIDWDFTPQKPLIIENNDTLKQIQIPKRFIGRRKQLRELAVKLQSSAYQQLLITGPGGQGKTALASKLVKDLQRQGKQVLVYSAHADFASRDLWDDFWFELEMLLDESHGNLYNQKVNHCNTDLACKIKLILRLLMRQLSTSAEGLVILFDNLESVQDPQTQALKDDNFRLWIEQIQQLNADKLTLIITSRWKLANWQDDDHLQLEHISYSDYLQLAHISYSDYLQLARQSTLLQQLHQQPQQHNGSNTNQLTLREIHQALHGNPRALTFFGAALEGLNAQQSEDLLKALQQAKAEIQVDMALQAVIEQRSPSQQNLLSLMRAYETPVTKEGIIKLLLADNASQDDQQTLKDLEQLINVSLIEKTHDLQMQASVYQCSTLLIDYLKQKNPQPPALSVLQAAADYQYYLLDKRQKPTLDQAIISHRAYLEAQQIDKAHRLVLDWIIGWLNPAGKYQLLLQQWLPDICQSTNQQIKAEALNQTGMQYHQLGDYKNSLAYFQHSLKIQLEIGDKSGEGTTLNNISQIYDARGDYETALAYLQRSLKIRQEIGDNAGMCATLFNMGHIYFQNEQIEEAMNTWLTVYQIAKPMELAYILEGLAGLAEQLDIPEGLQGWEALLQARGE